MKYAGIQYKAFGEQGEYMRDAHVIAELPTIEQRKDALQDATQGLGKLLGMTAVHPIQFGEPVYSAFGIRRAEAKKHKQAELLLILGGSVPLKCCN